MSCARIWLVVPTFLLGICESPSRAVLGVIMVPSCPYRVLARRTSNLVSTCAWSRVDGCFSLYPPVVVANCWLSVKHCQAPSRISFKPRLAIFPISSSHQTAQSLLVMIAIVHRYVTIISWLTPQTVWHPKVIALVLLGPLGIPCQSWTSPAAICHQREVPPTWGLR